MQIEMCQIFFQSFIQNLTDNYKNIQIVMSKQWCTERVTGVMPPQWKIILFVKILKPKQFQPKGKKFRWNRKVEGKTPTKKKIRVQKFDRIKSTYACSILLQAYSHIKTFKSTISKQDVTSQTQLTKTFNKKQTYKKDIQ